MNQAMFQPTSPVAMLAASSDCLLHNSFLSYLEWWPLPALNTGDGVQSFSEVRKLRSQGPGMSKAMWELTTSEGVTGGGLGRYLAVRRFTCQLNHRDMSAWKLDLYGVRLLLGPVGTARLATA